MSVDKPPFQDKANGLFKTAKSHYESAARSGGLLQSLNTVSTGTFWPFSKTTPFILIGKRSHSSPILKAPAGMSQSPSLFCNPPRSEVEVAEAKAEPVRDPGTGDRDRSRQEHGPATCISETFSILKDILLIYLSAASSK